MSIATDVEIRNILQLDSSYDAIIGIIRPQLEAMIIEDYHENFKNKNIAITAATLTFNASTITDSQSNFTEAYFNEGDYWVEDSLDNDGYITVTGVTDSVLTCSQTFNTESELATPTITKLKYGNKLKVPLAADVKAVMDTDYMSGKTSERIGSHSWTIDSSGMGTAKDMIGNVRKAIGVRYV